ncbi:MAG: ATP-binding protein [Pseudomonadota bacterium]
MGAEGCDGGDVTKPMRVKAETLKEVAEAAAAAEAYARDAAGADEEQALRVGLAADELAANALIHGARGPVDLWVEVWSDDAFVHLQVSALGPCFDPRAFTPQERPDGDLGGYGLALIHQFVDSLDYERVDSRNVTRASVRKRAALGD